MYDFFLLISIVLSCFFLQWLFHQLDKNRISSILRGTIIHVMGGCILLYFGSDLKFLAATLYFFLYLLFCFLLFHISLDGQTPIDTIFEHFAKKNPTTKKNIFDLFEEKKLIDIRIENLKKSNLVVINEDNIVLTNKGKHLWNLINKIFNICNLNVYG